MKGSDQRRLAPLGALAVGIMVPVTLPVPILRELVQQRFDVSELQTSLFMSINMVGALLAAPLVGALSDRIGRRPALLAGALGLDTVCFLGLTMPLSFGAFLAIRFVEGCAHIVALSMLLSLASHALPTERRGRAMGFVGGSMMLGVALGAPLGGLLGRGGPLLPLQAAAGLLGAAVILAGTSASDSGEREDRPGFGQIASALRAHPGILVPLAFAFADRFTVGFFTTTFSLYLSGIFELSSARIGLAITAFMLPFAALSYPFGRLAETRSTVALMCGGSLLYGIGTASVGFVGPPAIFALMFAIGVTAAVMFVPSMVMTTQIAPDAIRTTALGAFNSAGSLGFVLGPVAGGLISQVVAARTDWLTGYRAAFAAAGFSELLCVAVALPILVRMRGRWRAASEVTQTSDMAAPDLRLEEHPTHLRVHFGAGESADFHWFWLRHHCDCCRHPVTNERTLCPSRVRLDIRPHSVSLEDDGESVLIVFEEEEGRHETRFGVAWLRANAYAPDRAGHAPPPGDLAAIELECPGLGAGLVDRCRTRLARAGAVLVRSAGCDTEALIEVFEASGWRVIPTHFGRIEDLRTDNTTNQNTDQLGYTDAPVDLHTDQPFIEHPPRYQLLHCMRAADTGGESVVADGFAAARHLESVDRQAWELLTRVPVRFHRVQKRFESLQVRPIIELRDEDVVGVRSSYFTMAPQQADFAEMEGWYRAYQRFAALIADPSHHYRFALSPGDFLLYDNHRMLHARTSFVGARWVRGVYFSHEGI